MFAKKFNPFIVICAALGLLGTVANAETNPVPSYDDLLQLFADWREFESPALLDGAPDYTVEGFAARQDEFLALRARLQAYEINSVDPSEGQGGGEDPDQDMMKAA